MLPHRVPEAGILLPSCSAVLKEPHPPSCHRGHLADHSHQEPGRPSRMHTACSSPCLWIHDTFCLHSTSSSHLNEGRWTWLSRWFHCCSEAMLNSFMKQVKEKRWVGISSAWHGCVFFLLLLSMYLPICAPRDSQRDILSHKWKHD